MSLRPESTAPHLEAALDYAGPFVDWGPVPTMIEGSSHTSGVVLWRGSDGAEAGIWRCTPGKWRCEVTRDEFCSFVSGRCTYVHDTGETIEIAPGTAAVFPAGWQGTCTVHETVQKLYMIR